MNELDGFSLDKDSDAYQQIIGQPPVGLQLSTYTVATLPSAVTNVRRMVYVSNETGGAVPAFSDGTNWRRVTDRAIVS